jgi:hypothetical protein
VILAIPFFVLAITALLVDCPGFAVLCLLFMLFSI